MRIGKLEYEPCGHTSHWSCVPPKDARKDVIYDPNNLFASKWSIVLIGMTKGVLALALICLLPVFPFLYLGWIAWQVAGAIIDGWKQDFP